MLAITVLVNKPDQSCTTRVVCWVRVCWASVGAKVPVREQCLHNELLSHTHTRTRRVQVNEQQRASRFVRTFVSVERRCSRLPLRQVQVVHFRCHCQESVRTPGEFPTPSTSAFRKQWPLCTQPRRRRKLKVGIITSAVHTSQSVKPQDGEEVGLAGANCPHALYTTKIYEVSCLITPAAAAAALRSFSGEH